MQQNHGFKRLDAYLPAAREAASPAPTSPQLGRTTTSEHERVSGLPRSRLADSFGTFDLAANPAMELAAARALEVAVGERWCALLVGTPGNGKTHLAIAAMHRFGLMRSMFWKVPDFLSWLRKMSIEEGRNIDDVLRPYREQDFLLVFDDLGVENRTDWAYEQLYRVLDARYDEKLPTIITSNQLPDRLDERLLSRFGAGMVVCAGKDLRRQFDA